MMFVVFLRKFRPHGCQDGLESERERVESLASLHPSLLPSFFLPSLFPHGRAGDLLNPRDQLRHPRRCEELFVFLGDTYILSPPELSLFFWSPLGRVEVVLNVADPAAHGQDLLLAPGLQNMLARGV